jgi:hypothetical protein
MIAEIIPEIYDVAGRATGTPTTKKSKRLFQGTFPMARYISQPLKLQCKNLKEMQRFLRNCKYVSDEEQFHRSDYWMPPEEFEKRRKGDCDDFALWTWRQLLGMGYKARYVVGRAGKYGEGHAWVTMERDGKHFLVEPLLSYVGKSLPRMSIIRYEPQGSVDWDGKKLHYFTHEKRELKLPILMIPLVISEWLFLWGIFYLRVIYYIILFPYYFTKRFKKN